MSEAFAALLWMMYEPSGMVFQSKCQLTWPGAPQSSQTAGMNGPPLNDTCIQRMGSALEDAVPVRVMALAWDAAPSAGLVMRENGRLWSTVTATGAETASFPARSTARHSSA